MSIEKTPKGEYRVRWRAGGKNKSKVTGPRKQDALTPEERRASVDPTLMYGWITGKSPQEWIEERDVEIIAELEAEKAKLVGALEHEKERRRKARADLGEFKDGVEAVMDDLRALLEG